MRLGGQFELVCGEASFSAPIWPLCVYHSPMAKIRQSRVGGIRANSARVYLVLALSFFLGWPEPAAAYAVLTHEAIIDSAWKTDIRPLLLKRFPNATPEQLRE